MTRDEPVLYCMNEWVSLICKQITQTVTITLSGLERPQVIPGYDLRPSHCARVGHIGRSVYLPWGTIVRGQNVSYVPTSHGSVGNMYTHK